MHIVMQILLLQQMKTENLCLTYQQLDAGEYKIIDVSFNLYKIFDLTTFIPEYEPCSAGLSYYVNEIE